MSRVLLDASALLAFLNSEPGGNLVPVTSGDAVMSAVNYSETIAVMTARGLSEDVIRHQLSQIVIDVLDFDLACAQSSGFMIAATTGKGLSFGDRACLATALREKIPVLTSDRSWTAVDVGATVQLIR